MNRKCKLGLILAMTVATVSASALADVPAKWQPKEVKFHYTGFTTAYSCSGIKDKLKVLLRQLGARDDVRVEGACPEAQGDPYPYYSLLLGFSIPAPAKTAITGETFPARWQEVKIGYHEPSDLSWGDCELIEQFRDQVLPELGAREVVDQTACTPHQLSVGDPSLTVTVLKAVA